VTRQRDTTPGTPSSCDAAPPRAGRSTSSGRYFVGPTFEYRLPAIMRKHIYTGAMGSSYIHLAKGMFLAAYGRELGISYFAWGVMAALNSFAIGFQLLSARLSARTGQRRTIWFVTSVTCRILVGLAILSAFYFSNWNVLFASAAFVLFMAASSAFGSLSAPPWHSWLTDLIPAEQHGTFMGRRSSWIAFTVIALLLPSAWFIDEWTSVGLGLYAMMIVFSVGLALGYVDLFIHNTIPEPAMKPERSRSFRDQVMTVLRDRAFRPWLLFRCSWNFSMSLGGAMMMFYFLENLGFRNRMVTGVLFITAVPLLGQVFGAKYTGILVDKLGTRSVIRAGHLAWSMIPMFWFFVTRDTSVWWLIVWQLITGVAKNAAMNAGKKLVLRVPRREDCSMYMAVSSCLLGAAAGLGSFTAGAMLDMLDGFTWHLGGLELSGFHVLYIISSSLRLGSTMLTRWLPDHAAETKIIERSRRKSVAVAS